MEFAFVSASAPFASAFSGVALSQSTSQLPVKLSSSSTTTNTPRAQLSKLNQYKDAGTEKLAPAPSAPSNWWVAYRDSVKMQNAPYRAAWNPEAAPAKSQAVIMPGTIYARMAMLVSARTTPQGGNPDTMVNLPIQQVADRYMADCIQKQYKAAATPYGVYTVQCTEGVTKGQAEESRNLSVSSSFRMKQRSSTQMFTDYFETRRHALIAAHGCGYEEKLVSTFPISARAFVTSRSEAMGNCVRYADGVSEEEKYMASSVDKQMKFRAVPYGVYDVLCSDGNAKNVAEYKRVSAMSAVFRAKQLPKSVQAQAKYNNAAYARDFYAHGCTYEENIFDKFPAVAASMRPSTARY